MSGKSKWDLFISHASEDKEEFVKPLASLLTIFGIKVWYDQFSLKLGDSLSRSIDMGLAKSRYGVVVISKAFMEKRWPEYELQGLVTLERAGKRNRIIPIWHGVSQNEVMKYSPSLADKYAGNTSSQDIAEITADIIEVVRPDIFQNLMRRFVYNEMVKNAPIEYVPTNKINSDGPIRHTTLPASLLVRIQVIHNALYGVLHYTLEEQINNFRRDIYPEREVEIWERIVAAYLSLTSGRDLTLEHKEEVFGGLLLASMAHLREEDFSNLHYTTMEMIGNAWKNTFLNVDGGEKPNY